MAVNHIDELKRENLCLWLQSLAKDKHIAELKAEKKATCRWKCKSSAGGFSVDDFWITECGKIWEFSDGGPKENKVKFCMYCGKKVEKD